MRRADYQGLVCLVYQLDLPLMEELAWELAEAGAQVVGQVENSVDLDEISFAMRKRGFRFKGITEKPHDLTVDPLDIAFLPMAHTDPRNECRRQDIVQRLAEAGRGQMVEVDRRQRGIIARLCTINAADPNRKNAAGSAATSLSVLLNEIEIRTARDVLLWVPRHKFEEVALDYGPRSLASRS